MKKTRRIAEEGIISGEHFSSWDGTGKTALRNVTREIDIAAMGSR